ncbi:MAG: hypothetical protein FWD01_02795, partial [Defluviitaleaceae bacterium]|nr:hypothetical protein [Defluviitaleaceae bacterium]
MIKNKKIYAALVTTLGCVLIFHILGSSIALANDLARLREQRQGLLSETRTAEDSLAEVRQEQNSVLTEIAELDVELDAVSAEYFTAAENLEATTNLLSDTENALIRAEGQRIEQNEILRSRIRFMHENSNYSYIEILFSSANLADFLNNVEHLGQIIEHDNSVLGQLIATEEQISIYRDEVAIRQMEVDLQAQELSVRRHALEEVLEERTAQIVRLDADEQTFLEQIRILEEADREIEQLIRAAEEAERQRVAAAQAQARARNNANQRNNNNSSQQSVAASGPMSWP